MSIMDEPCSAFAPISTKQVEELCFEQEHYTIILMTHNIH
jgi:ABC-type phosphate transport system ATPase subunit